MSTTTTIAPAISNITGAPDGIVRLFVPTGLDVSKTDLLNAARKIAGTINVGRVPAGKGAKLHGVTGHIFDFAPVQRTTAAAKAAGATPVPTEDPRVAVLVGMGMTPDQAAAIVGTMAPVAPAAKVPAAKAEPKADREVPAFLRKWQDVTCKTCRDFGKVRGPGAGSKAGRPFRTQHGADSAPTAVPCTSHVAKARGGRKAKSA